MLRMKCLNIIIVLAIGTLLSACGNDEWNKTDQNKLLKRCMDEGGAKSYCKCYLSKAMEAYPSAKEVDDLDFEAAVELSINCE